MAETPPDLVIPISDRSAHLARVHLGVTIPLLVVTLVPLVARVYVRVWPVWRFGWDDALILAGFAAAVTDWALLEHEMFLQAQSVSLDRAVSAVKLSYIGIFLWNVAMTCIKTSIALTLLRIPLAHRAWRPSLFAILAVQTTYFVGDTIYIFAKCRPLSAAWDLSAYLANELPSGTCTDLVTDVLVSSIGSALNVLTDMLLSLAPMWIIWKLHRPRRERIFVCCLTGMGLFASGASIAKAVMVGRWGTHKDADSWALSMSIATWTIVEQFVAVFAACSPSLKGPIEALLARFGIALTGPASHHFSFLSMFQSRGDREAAAARRREEALEAAEAAVMERGRSGPVVFRDGEDLVEKTKPRSSRSRRHRNRHGGSSRTTKGSRPEGRPPDAVASAGESEDTTRASRREIAPPDTIVEE
ncbi:hypothetical protein QBC47DRAFT_175887 [Echria macrotheca]|uniref:Rhodopsin domain-containing protein n=1 Tax=Echria macrotheca TaxID=438768 RepID=A0AAJ0BF61_9PEZI|nr:hypothetical protein QBC47DRAFT_175887 [Echria macrotheca]